MIRPARPADLADALRAVVASGLFSPEDAGLVEGMLVDFFTDPRDHLCLVDDTDGIRGVAYAEPWRATDGAWELTMIAVEAAAQGEGVGTELLTRVEERLRGDGRRLLLVATSGLPAFVQARGFYAARGYDEEARVRELWTAGDDMVLFRKALQATSVSPPVAAGAPPP